MCDLNDYAELVKKAQLGDRGSLTHLAEAARIRLHEYVFRLTLNEDLTGDIVQETILEMLKIFGKLRRAEKFWPWLYGIAFNKTRNYYGKRWRQRTHAFSETGYEPTKPAKDDTLAEVVTDELKHIVLKSVEQLSPSHRAILTMRCYDHLSYAEIAKLIGCSEIGARASFCRAKRSLARRLADYGLGKHSLLLALVVFGKVTAGSEATAAQVAVSAATLEAGPLAALLAAMVSRTALVALATAGSLAIGTATVNNERIATTIAGALNRPDAVPIAPWQSHSAAQQECWYYFPAGGSSPVMMRLVEMGPAGEDPTCRVLQNQYATYIFDARTGVVHISNHRIWKPDLSVMRLPTDAPALSAFIATVEGRRTDMESTPADRPGTLVICRQQSSGENLIWRVERHRNVLNEEYFLYSWPDTATVVDNRDTMHQRGWTYFRVEGRLAGRTVSGKGRLPFIHAAARQHYPWLRLDMGGREVFVDTPAGSRVYDEAGRIIVRSQGGSFFAGLPRPWMGLHAIDTIRRDVAEKRLRFDTTYDNRTGCATVTVYMDGLRLVYTVNMEADVVESIAFFAEGPAGTDYLGELRFDYLQEIAGIGDAFAAPRDIRPGSVVQQASGLLWLKQLIEDM